MGEHDIERLKDMVKQLTIELEASRNANMYLRECHSDWSTKAIEWKEKYELLQLEIYELESKLALQNILMFDIPEWISVKDQLPPNGGIYTVFRPDAWDEPHCDPRISSRKFADGKWSGLHEVTHWQPLPKPPKELNK